MRCVSENMLFCGVWRGKCPPNAAMCSGLRPCAHTPRPPLPHPLTPSPQERGKNRFSLPALGLPVRFATQTKKAWWRWLCAVIALLFSSIGGQSGYADTLPEITPDPAQIQRVAFFPHAIPIYVYKDVPLNTDLDVLHLKRSLIDHTQSLPYFSVLSAEEIEKAYLTAPLKDVDAFTQAESDMGFVQNYMINLNYASAITMLHRIIPNYEASLTQFYQPKSVARAHQMLAYATIAAYQDALDRNETISPQMLDSARNAFVELIRLAPYLTMLEGRQAPERVRLYDEALESFLSDPDVRRTPAHIAAALSHKLSADILIFVRIVQNREALLTLELDLYRAKDQNIEYHQIPLPFLNAELSSHDKVLDEVTRTLDEFFACIEIPPPPVDAQPPFGIQFGFLYHAFINTPTSHIPNGFGAYITFSWHFSTYFFLRAEFDFAATLQDSAHTLNDVFEVYRFPILFGINYTWRWFRPFFAFGLDLSFTSPYSIVTSRECKTFGLDDRECLPGDVRAYRGVFAINLAFSAGFSIVIPPFAINVESFIDATVYPRDSLIFKYPFGARVGFEYQF